MAMLEINDLHVNYGMIAALKGISFEVNEGEDHFPYWLQTEQERPPLCTPLQVLSLQNRVLSNSTAWSLQKLLHTRSWKGIAHVPEGRRIFQNLTVLDNLKLGAFTRKDKENIPKDIQDIYEAFP